ncbi:ABC transporter substrate-binding protein [Sulfidibacter corallicola]|uniref:ABC transporter substrate-binding protein n=1 Tax=Sulfidibacter corallicola TaxID=2818388 RepID=A0A8A4TTA3_SULCO|nr:ABC transporter substrate-binding protein [Sulfidibacter corallicola]QTD49775.1 ABC transporter substrate-binding protein [Sulfidibacter corallicola]
MKKHLFIVFLLTLSGMLPRCAREPVDPKPKSVHAMMWEEIEAEALGQVVRFSVWRSDRQVIRYLEEFVAPQMKTRYGVRLEITRHDAFDLREALLARSRGEGARIEADLLWTSVDTFRYLKERDVLGGPIGTKLPNAALINWPQYLKKLDCQNAMNGYAVPWGHGHLTMVYNRDRVPEPPSGRAELAAWIRANPGRFTFDTSPLGMRLMHAWLVDMAGGPPAVSGDFDADRYEAVSDKMWHFFEELKPFLWQEGRMFPKNMAELHDLYARGEVDITLAGNLSEAQGHILRGEFPQSSECRVWPCPAAQCAHYLSVARDSHAVAGALVTLNFLLSKEAQLEKLKPNVWGDETVLDMEALPRVWVDRFTAIQTMGGVVRPMGISSYAGGLAMEYRARLCEEFVERFR